MKRIAILLSGCGYLDGSEITETVSALIALDQLHVHVQCFAPSLNYQSIDHVKASPDGVEKNALNEAARIARGNILNLAELQDSQFDGLLLPGGFGAAKNLCSWASEGARCQVLPDVERVLRAFHKSQKPIAAICIAPAVVARVLGSHGIYVTIGNDPATAQEIEKTGALHENCPVTEYVSDRDQRILSTPAYMYEATPAEVFTGISKMIREFVEIA